MGKAAKSKISIKKLIAAKREGLLYFKKHYSCEVPCDHCGKTKPSHFIIIFKDEKEKAEVLEDEANGDEGLYLNTQNYIVGSDCLSKIKKLVNEADIDNKSLKNKR